MTDLYLEWNSDLVLTPSGSLQTAINWDQTRERIVRHMITNSAQTLPDGSMTPADYVFAPSYGIGLGSMVDQNPTASFLTSLKQRINQAVFSDATVNPGYSPNISISTPNPSTFQIFISVLLINGQPGEVELTLD